MDELEYLRRNIEKLRGEMTELVRKKGSLLHPSVVEKSTMLDKYIVKYQEILNRKKKRTY